MDKEEKSRLPLPHRVFLRGGLQTIVFATAIEVLSHPECVIFHADNYIVGKFRTCIGWHLIDKNERAF